MSTLTGKTRTPKAPAAAEDRPLLAAEIPTYGQRIIAGNDAWLALDLLHALWTGDEDTLEAFQRYADAADRPTRWIAQQAAADLEVAVAYRDLLAHLDDVTASDTDCLKAADRLIDAEAHVARLERLVKPHRRRGQRTEHRPGTERGSTGKAYDDLIRDRGRTITSQWRWAYAVVAAEASAHTMGGSTFPAWWTPRHLKALKALAERHQALIDAATRLRHREPNLTGRDKAAVRQHIDRLAVMIAGQPDPGIDTIPTLPPMYDDAALVGTVLVGQGGKVTPGAVLSQTPIPG